MAIHKGIPGYPIVVAANRDEYSDRPTQGPHQLAHTPVVWGGRDTRAGGTWLGVNAYGLVIGLTNRRIREDQENDPQRRSRGLLCLEALQCRTATEAADFLAREPAERYNPFNLLMLDQQKRYVFVEPVVCSSMRRILNGDDVYRSWSKFVVTMRAVSRTVRPFVCIGTMSATVLYPRLSLLSPLQWLAVYIAMLRGIPAPFCTKIIPTS